MMAFGRLLGALRVSRLPRPGYSKCESPPVFEWLHPAFDFKYRVPNRGESMAPVGTGEQLRFHDAGPVGDGHKLHGFTGDLMVRPMLDHQAASGDRLSDEVGKASYRTVCLPGYAGE